MYLSFFFPPPGNAVQIKGSASKNTFLYFILWGVEVRETDFSFLVLSEQNQIFLALSFGK